MRTPVGHPGSPDRRRQGGFSEDDERSDAAGWVTTASRAGPPPCGLRRTTGKQGRPRFYGQASSERLAAIPLEDLALGFGGRIKSVCPCLLQPVPSKACMGTSTGASMLLMAWSMCHQRMEVMATPCHLTSRHPFPWQLFRTAMWASMKFSTEDCNSRTMPAI